MSVLSDAKLREIYNEACKPHQTVMAAIRAGLRAVAEAAVRAEREGAVPRVYAMEFSGTGRIDMLGSRTEEQAREFVERCRRNAPNVRLVALYTHPPQASATVPEGMVMVPVKPTERMLDHAVAFALNVGPAQSGGWTEYARRMWETMVIAAASQPGDEKEGCGYTCPGRGACKAQEGT